MERINITLPADLIRQAKLLIEEGLFSNFSELVREGIKDELRLEMPLIQKRHILRELVKTIGEGKDLKGWSKEEIISELRKTRNQLWDQKYKDWFAS